MTHSVSDIDLTPPAKPSTEEAEPADYSEIQISHGSASELEFKIWDGRTVVMRRLPLALTQQIHMAALDKEPENPIKANSIGRDECIKATLKRVGDLTLGVGGASSEHLYKALSDLGLGHARAAYNMMTSTTEEQDGAFLVSIVAR